MGVSTKLVLSLFYKEGKRFYKEKTIGGKNLPEIKLFNFRQIRNYIAQILYQSIALKVRCFLFTLKKNTLFLC